MTHKAGSLSRFMLQVRKARKQGIHQRLQKRLGLVDFHYQIRYDDYDDCFRGIIIIQDDLAYAFSVGFTLSAQLRTIEIVPGIFGDQHFTPNGRIPLECVARAIGNLAKATRAIIEEFPA